MYSTPLNFITIATTTGVVQEAKIEEDLDRQKETRENEITTDQAGMIGDRTTGININPSQETMIETTIGNGTVNENGIETETETGTVEAVGIGMKMIIKLS